MLLSYIEGHVGLGELVAWLLGVTVAITVHEFAHARRALAAGDTTPLAMGRVTLNPLAHYDPIGTTLFVFAGFGWAKPVPVNPSSFAHPRKDGLWVALWGPLSNVLLATFLAGLLRLGITGPYTPAVAIMTYANCVLAIFNLIPIGPLDGAHILEGLLPPEQAQRYAMFQRQYGQFIVIGAIFVLFAAPGVLMLPINAAFSLLSGAPLGYWLFL
jgi:Zn-dependent protease